MLEYYVKDGILGNYSTGKESHKHRLVLCLLLRDKLCEF